ncbi:hypothetical protein MLD38_004689 [Melastoma candidum]|uniref:Uncharacterized protein n=1 Tax=Melastoma candidum TaxID=119954 RepID=A0ACB9S6D4_9MYRT|nr:hypothetical protein MLD38_004689 [Melastoma candidum]
MRPRYFCCWYYRLLFLLWHYHSVEHRCLFLGVPIRHGPLGPSSLLLLLAVAVVLVVASLASAGLLLSAASVLVFSSVALRRILTAEGRLATRSPPCSSCPRLLPDFPETRSYFLRCCLQNLPGVVPVEFPALSAAPRPESDCPAYRFDHRLGSPVSAPAVARQCSHYPWLCCSDLLYRCFHDLGLCLWFPLAALLLPSPLVFICTLLSRLIPLQSLLALFPSRTNFISLGITITPLPIVDIVSLPASLFFIVSVLAILRGPTLLRSLIIVISTRVIRLTAVTSVSVSEVVVLLVVAGVMTEFEFSIHTPRTHSAMKNIVVMVDA